MKYIVLLNGKPIEQATLAEKQKLEEKVKEASTKYFKITYENTKGGKENGENSGN